MNLKDAAKIAGATVVGIDLVITASMPVDNPAIYVAGSMAAIAGSHLIMNHVVKTKENN